VCSFGPRYLPLFTDGSGLVVVSPPGAALFEACVSLIGVILDVSLCASSLVSVISDKGVLPLLTAVFSSSLAHCVTVYDSLYQSLGALLASRPVAASKQSGLQVRRPVPPLCALCRLPSPHCSCLYPPPELTRTPVSRAEQDEAEEGEVLEELSSASRDAVSFADSSLRRAHCIIALFLSLSMVGWSVRNQEVVSHTVGATSSLLCAVNAHVSPEPACLSIGRAEWIRCRFTDEPNVSPDGGRGGLQGIPG
jgi:hypothetical protein